MAKGAYWVIGGTSGIGAAIVSRLKSDGADYVHVTGEECDVRSDAALGREREKLHAISGDDFHSVVYCAGISRLSWLGRMGVQGLRHASDVLDVNCLGFIRLLNTLGDDNIGLGSKPFSVVAISSDAARRPMRTSAAYCASKAALDMVVRVAAREMGPYGWRINAVSPGMVEGTIMSKAVDAQVKKTRHWNDEYTRSYERQQEVVPGRIPPEDVASIVVDVLHGPKHLNGSIVEFNGGR